MSHKNRVQPRPQVLRPYFLKAGPGPLLFWAMSINKLDLGNSLAETALPYWPEHVNRKWSHKSKSLVNSAGPSTWSRILGVRPVELPNQGAPEADARPKCKGNSQKCLAVFLAVSLAKGATQTTKGIGSLRSQGVLSNAGRNACSVFKARCSFGKS